MAHTDPYECKLGINKTHEEALMNHDRVMRRALQVTTPFNLLAAYALAFPASSLGEFFGLPTDAPALYRTFAGGAIALFGFAYGWLSMQPMIDRPLVVVSICGKLFAFTSLVVLALLGQVPVRAAVLGTGDLIFASVFIWWCFDAQSVASADH